MDPRLNYATSSSKLPCWPVKQNQLKTQLQQLQLLLRTQSIPTSERLQKLQAMLRSTPQPPPPVFVDNNSQRFDNQEGQSMLCPPLASPHFGAMEASKNLAPHGSASTVPLSIANSCPYLVDFNRSAPQPTPPSGTVDLNQALSTYIERKHWLDYEHTQASAHERKAALTGIYPIPTPVAMPAQACPVRPDAALNNKLDKLLGRVDDAVKLYMNTGQPASDGLTEQIAEAVAFLNCQKLQKSANQAISSFEKNMQPFQELMRPSTAKNTPVVDDQRAEIEQEYGDRERDIIDRIQKNQSTLYKALLECRMQKNQKLKELSETGGRTAPTMMAARKCNSEAAVHEASASEEPLSSSEIMSQIKVKTVPVVSQHREDSSHIRGPNHELGKKSRQIYDCPHTDRRYYAKGMCVNCYHRQGRTKKAWACEHTRKTHYSKGLCKYCYLANYYKGQTDKKGYNRSKKASSDSSNRVNSEDATPPKLAADANSY